MQTQLRSALLRWTVLAVAVVLVSAYGWRLRAQPSLALRSQASTPLASVAPAAGIPINDQGPNNTIDQMGGTYNFLEGKAKRLTTRFGNGSAVAERGMDGTLKTQLLDSAGNEVVLLRVLHGDHGGSEVAVSQDQQIQLHARIRPEVQPTLDWITLQAYAIRKDGASADVEWQGRFLRSRGLKSGNLDDQVQEVSTEFDGGITVTTSRTTAPATGQRRPTTLTIVQANGSEVGRMLWFAHERALAWKFPGLTDGMVDDERLKGYYGGWTFTPTTAWTNVQGIAFYQFHTQLKTQGSVARTQDKGTGGRWLKKIADAIAPTLHADTSGCDGLHWLDHSLYRPCCDTHDFCYYKAGCTSASWWYWPRGSNWTCSYCNALAAGCFATTLLYPGSYWCPYGSYCYY